MQVMFDAIAQRGPADVRADSPVTEERSDGSTSRVPVWTTSESGVEGARAGRRIVSTDSTPLGAR